jgi:hypothetical protein
LPRSVASEGLFAAHKNDIAPPNDLKRAATKDRLDATLIRLTMGILRFAHNDLPIWDFCLSKAILEVVLFRKGGVGSFWQLSPLHWRFLFSIYEDDRSCWRVEVKRTASTLWANIFMWLVVLAAAFVLLWDSDQLWMMVIAIFGAGAGSHMVFCNGLRNLPPPMDDRSQGK